MPATQFSVNGLVELLPFNDEFMLVDGALVLGRRARHRQHDQALLRRVPAARRTWTALDSIAGLADSCGRRRRRCCSTCARSGIPLDNVEGMTLGPQLPDGRRSLVLVSDNNFAASQFTQFLLFALDSTLAPGPAAAGPGAPSARTRERRQSGRFGRPGRDSRASRLTSKATVEEVRAHPGDAGGRMGVVRPPCRSEVVREVRRCRAAGVARLG